MPELAPSTTLTWKTARRALTIGARPLIMGIFNLTPDSFSDGGQITSPEMARDRALAAQSQGVDILDLGAESTRPGATPLDVEEEWRRLEPSLKILASNLRIPISIDTYKPEIAHRALDLGAEIINDVSGGNWWPGMAEMLAQRPCGYILTHSQGTPQTMQKNPTYTDVVTEVSSFLFQKKSELLQLGLPEEYLVLDPGLGFGKTPAHNLELLVGLERLTRFGRPVLVGVSRKSFLKKIAGEDALEVSTLAAQVWASAQGAHIWRVHDPVAAIAAARVVEQLQLVRKLNT